MGGVHRGKMESGGLIRVKGRGEWRGIGLRWMEEGENASG